MSLGNNSFLGDYDSILDSGAKIRVNAYLFKEKLQTLESLMNSLKANWTGLAANSYYTSYDEIKLLLDSFQTLLDDLGSGVGNAGTILANNEEEVNADARKIGNMNV